VVSQVDLAATFAKIIDYPLGKKDAIDSYNLLPVLEGRKYSKPLRVATVQNTNPKKFALRQGDWVLIDAPTGAAKKESSAYLKHFKLDPYGKGHQGLLFNLKEDPRQASNLYDKFPERVIKMRSLLKEYLSGKPCAPTK
jgi:arylsulfatase A